MSIRVVFISVSSPSISDPRAGVFGPRSRLWQVNRHTITFLGAGRAALLQNAHPFVAHAIRDHSKTFENPIARGHRTFANVFAMVYGDLETAFAAARRVFAIHERIHGRLDEDVGRFRAGTPYSALDEDALLWVHATLWETSIRMHELVLGPLALEDKQAYYADTRRFAALFGLAKEQLPRDWLEFEEYNAAMWSGDTLAVGSRAREICRYLLHPPTSPLRAVLPHYEVIVAGTLPAPLRHAYALRFDARRDRLRFELALRALSAAAPRLPRRLRWLPAYVDARHRLAGRPQPDRLSQGLGRLFVGPPARA